MTVSRRVGDVAGTEKGCCREAAAHAHQIVRALRQHVAPGEVDPSAEYHATPDRNGDRTRRRIHRPWRAWPDAWSHPEPRLHRRPTPCGRRGVSAGNRRRVAVRASQAACASRIARQMRSLVAGMSSSRTRERFQRMHDGVHHRRQRADAARLARPFRAEWVAFRRHRVRHDAACCTDHWPAACSSP